ncbi:cytochrome P450 2K1-like [Brachionichthys hirsutus]|uniref:cytochrome P450 2K1-like n=1 Tax=Brachionichthys hirsutus TaxID=412623 RepID=UPI003604EB99
MFEDLLQSSTSVSLLVVAGVLLGLHLVYSAFCSKENTRAPPGPKPLPLLGNLLQLDFKRLDISLLNLSKKYGSVFTVYFGSKKVVVLAGYKTVKQALVDQDEDFGERSVSPIFNDINKGYGIVFSNGITWQEMKPFALTALRSLETKGLTEEKIIEECHQLIKSFQQYNGKAFDNSRTLACAAINIISALTFGRRYEYTDPVLQAMVDQDLLSISHLKSTSIQMYNIFPWLGPFIKNRRDLVKGAEIKKEESERIIADLKETLIPGKTRCYVDEFLIHRSKLEESEIRHSQYNDVSLVHCVRNLFQTGTITAENKIKWSLLLMAKYPRIQDQVQEELRRVVGRRQVRVWDRKYMPYTDAVLHEIHRFANIIPMAVPHRTSRDVTFQGYFIKKGTTVFPLLTSVLFDESEWENPHTFNPSRFLDKDGKLIRKDAFLPFSAGRRVCLGEGLARMELFLFLTSLLQQFRFTPPPGVTEDEMDLTPVAGVVLHPSPYELCAVNLY